MAGCPPVCLPTRLPARPSACQPTRPPACIWTANQPCWISNPPTCVYTPPAHQPYRGRQRRRPQPSHQNLAKRGAAKRRQHYTWAAERRLQQVAAPDYSEVGADRADCPRPIAGRPRRERAVCIANQADPHALNRELGMERLCSRDPWLRSPKSKLLVANTGPA